MRHKNSSEIQTDHQISARRPDLRTVNKKTEFAELWTLLPGNRVKLKECEKKDKYRDLARDLKKLWTSK